MASSTGSEAAIRRKIERKGKIAETSIFYNGNGFWFTSHGKEENNLSKSSYFLLCEKKLKKINLKHHVIKFSE